MIIPITNITFRKTALAEYQQWAAEDQQVFQKINTLLTEIIRDPFHGTGKPEPLKYEQTGYWSRRINGEDRIVYKVQGSELFVVSCKYHYQ